jgi:hypothetical protein
MQYASLLSHHSEFMYVEVLHPGSQWHVPRLLSREVHHVFLTLSQVRQLASDWEHHDV